MSPVMESFNAGALTRPDSFQGKSCFGPRQGQKRQAESAGRTGGEETHCRAAVISSFVNCCARPAAAEVPLE